jgi:hypothetical protein
MSNRTKGDQGEYEFTRAAYDELMDAGKRMGVEFNTFLEPADARGVWSLTVVAWKAMKDGGDRRLCSYQSRWPNSQVMSFGAFLYGATHRLVRMLEQQQADELKGERVSM